MKSKIIITIILAIMIVSVAVVYFMENQQSGFKLNCCKECTQIMSSIPGHDNNDSCSIFVDGYNWLPYKLSNSCKEYFKTNSNIKISECLSFFKT
jgi:hypothetical protein